MFNRLQDSKGLRNFQQEKDKFHIMMLKQEINNLYSKTVCKKRLYVISTVSVEEMFIPKLKTWC